MRTRIAPTPSGFLHEGNAANALLVSWLASQHDGTIVLRVDDMDALRARDQYVEDIFDVLTWLGIDWDEGPRDAVDLARHHSPSRWVDECRSALASGAETGLEVYACTCSRRMLDGPATGGCGCRTAGRIHEAGRTALRVHVPEGTAIEIDGQRVDVAAELGDFVVWRRDDLPAYQLLSVLQDDRMRITDVVRGQDLLPSSAAQVFMARGLGLASFDAMRFIHHGLAVDDNGRKLSKSQSVQGSGLPRDEATRRRVHDLARELGRPLGIAPPPGGDTRVPA